MESRIFIYNGSYITSYGDISTSDIAKNLGYTWEDYLAGKYVQLTEEQLAFMGEDATKTPEEVFFMKDNLEASTSDVGWLISRIKEYDTSEEINTFFVNDTPVWFSKEERAALSNSLRIEAEIGKEATVLWINGVAYSLLIEEAKKMFNSIEEYAIACFNNTSININKAKALKLKEEVNNFDITQGYPEKLHFKFKN